MSKKLLFVVLAVVTVTGAFAETTTQTIPTQSYVDTNFQTKIPAGSFGANNSVVTYGANAGDTQERLILHPKGIVNSDAVLARLVLAGNLHDADYPLTVRYKAALGATDEQFNNALLPAIYISRAMEVKNGAITPGTTGSVAIFNGADSRGGSQFTERAIYDGSTTYDATTDADKLITAGAVDNKQNKMTCTRWLDTLENPDHTDENCLLWSLSN